MRQDTISVFYSKVSPMNGLVARLAIGRAISGRSVFCAIPTKERKRRLPSAELPGHDSAAVQSAAFLKTMSIYVCNAVRGSGFGVESLILGLCPSYFVREHTTHCEFLFFFTPMSI